MKYKACIFDVDGTLLDSMGMWDSVGLTYLKKCGFDPDDRVFQILRDCEVRGIAKFIKENYPGDKTEKEMTDEMNGMIEKKYREEFQLKEYAGEFVQILKDRGFKLSVATATDRYLIEMVLKRLGLEEYFDFVLTCPEIGYSKSNPLIYEKSIEKHGVPKEEIILFEDALYAIKTGKELGLTVFGVYDKQENQDEVRKFSDCYLESFHDWKKYEKYFM